MTQEQDQEAKKGSRRLLLRITRISWRDLFASAAPVTVVSVVAIAIALHFVQPAPPNTIVIGGGPEGSIFRSVAEKYRTILARNGVKLEIVPTGGSLDNLKRLADDNARIDVGFVQGGVASGTDIEGLVSLGSVFYEPLSIVYRGPHKLQRLSQFKGKRVAIGPEGSGTRFLALALLKANEIEPGGATKLADLAGDGAVAALLKGQIDAAFIMADSASPASLRKVRHAKGIHQFAFPQADAYLGRFRYLSKLEIPAGGYDLGENLPPKPLAVLAPTVELVARDDLHPALSDLLIEAAREVHGHAGLLQKAGEFPAPLEHEYPISEDAARYYKSGKSFAYKHLPFWLASLADRVVVVLVPVVVVLIPGLRLIPTLYGWRIRRRIYRRYGEVMAVERAALDAITVEDRAELLARLSQIEKAIVSGKIPGSHADETYILRQHIKFVRERLAVTDKEYLA
ncbi:MAG TPA: TAXI family TRAP transporter solute-binding subunit [Rhodocyclaceae bacterium]|nr:TAXI family TRAP transporter solute-binding subunit [Rhodocyclaceae bacterium]